jgi:acyl-CoA dehydrogenase
MALEYGRTREVFGRLLGEHGQAQAMISDCAVEMEACRWLTYRAAAEADRGGDTRLLDSAVKLYASEMISRVSDRVMQLHGGWGYTKDFPIERIYRDSRMWRIVEGPNEVHRMLIARQLLKHGIGALVDTGSRPLAAIAP